MYIFNDASRNVRKRMLIIAEISSSSSCLKKRIFRTVWIILSFFCVPCPLPPVMRRRFAFPGGASLPRAPRRAPRSDTPGRRIRGHLAAETAHGFCTTAVCRTMPICLFFGIFVSAFQKTDTDKKSHAAPDVPSAGLFAQHAGLPFIINNNINRL